MSTVSKLKSLLASKSGHVSSATTLSEVIQEFDDVADKTSPMVLVLSREGSHDIIMNAVTEETLPIEAIAKLAGGCRCCLTQGDGTVFYPVSTSFNRGYYDVRFSSIVATDGYIMCTTATISGREGYSYSVTVVTTSVARSN